MSHQNSVRVFQYDDMKCLMLMTLVSVRFVEFIDNPTVNGLYMIIIK